ncbi:unnamed protein product [Mycetohabitans rhizoxinica HKI 454]|uniref:Uncharacterized protein n=1 Tax=Mycetohabitans rhizoxinica (strain DSM 19002 / CIP 109453 / HKI 454) TaxID=882378 RepID=E5APS2_MYCRK|nr:unnamed protein product [Mycetohabitans rhizoxinica HKI 454]
MFDGVAKKQLVVARDVRGTTKQRQCGMRASMRRFRLVLQSAIWFSMAVALRNAAVGAAIVKHIAGQPGDCWRRAGQGWR